VFVPVFLLSESSDGMLVATGCVAEIQLPWLGEWDSSTGSHARAGDGWEREQGSRRRGGGKRGAHGWTAVNRCVESSQQRAILPSLFAEREGSVGSLHVAQTLTSTRLRHVPHM